MRENTGQKKFHIWKLFTQCILHTGKHCYCFIKIIPTYNTDARLVSNKYNRAKGQGVHLSRNIKMTSWMLTVPIAAPKTVVSDIKQILYCSSCRQHLSRPQKIIVQLKTVNYFQSKRKCTRVSCHHCFLFFQSDLLFPFFGFYC